MHFTLSNFPASSFVLPPFLNDTFYATTPLVTLASKSNSRHPGQTLQVDIFVIFSYVPELGDAFENSLMAEIQFLQWNFMFWVCLVSFYFHLFSVFLTSLPLSLLPSCCQYPTLCGPSTWYSLPHLLSSLFLDKTPPVSLGHLLSCPKDNTRVTCRPCSYLCVKWLFYLQGRKKVSKCVWVCVCVWEREIKCWYPAASAGTCIRRRAFWEEILRSQMAVYLKGSVTEKHTPDLAAAGLEWINA